MRVLVLGMGLTGSALARGLVADGHEVVGTTTTPGKVEGLAAETGAAIQVLRGGDPAAVAEAAADCDAIVVTAGPSAVRSRTPEERAITYREVLVDTAKSVVEAPGRPHVVALSSLSVYGAAADHLEVVDEDAPLTDSSDPSPASFIAAERTYLDAAGDRACVLRCAEIYSDDDLSLEDKVRMGHEAFGGALPFSASPHFYRVHVDDVVGAVRHALEQRLTGVFNLAHTGIPPRNGEVFDTISARLGLPPFTYLDHIVSPSAPVSIDRLLGTGFTPTPHPPIAS
jgi:nucleoside-diphosphate-sugar epimerase